jgi:3-hydroxyacyl-CoA dehydrogenase
MPEIFHYCVENGVSVIAIDSPPVNALGQAVRQALSDGFARARSEPSTDAIVLMCEGRTFFAGADISEFGKPPVPPALSDVFLEIEQSAKPVTAAIHGTALGGGYELALVCHYRVAVPSAKVGLPEVSLGILPGLGGTQRLPRIVGPEKALEIIGHGKPLPAQKAFSLGMLDALVREGQLRDDAVAFARRMVDEGHPVSAVRDRDELLAPARGKAEIFDQFRQSNARAFRGFKAPSNIVKAIQAAVELPFDEGMARERELFLELRDSTESKAQRYYFFAERNTTKIPDIDASIARRPLEKVGVIGAGTMGGGITMNFLNAGIPVTLVEMTQEALDRGMSVIRKNYERSAKTGRFTAEQVEARMALISPALGLEALCDVDLTIEAVFEEMFVKKDIFAKLDLIMKGGSILATNTSFLDIDEIASVTSRPQDVVGLHFFSPANVMKLLEVVRGAKTAPDVVRTAIDLAKVIGKVAVLSRVCHGFIANRIMSQRGKQADRLVLEGTAPDLVDKALYDYGFAMGPFQMVDLVGLDVLGRNATGRTLRGDFVKAGRFGQKSGGGFYDYDADRKPRPSPDAAQIIADFAAFEGSTPKTPRSPEQIVAQLLYPVVNEGAKILEEGIALRASDIDVACVVGYNWPVYTGGPMFWADQIGLPKIVAEMRALEREYGEAFTPTPLLVKLAESGSGFSRKQTQ